MDRRSAKGRRSRLAASPLSLVVAAGSRALASGDARVFSTDVLVVDYEAYFVGRTAGALHEWDEHLLGKPAMGLESALF